MSPSPEDGPVVTQRDTRIAARSPALTSILPNYNHGAFIARAIGGLVGQTRPPDEIIVIDDASTDGSVALIEELARNIPALRLVRHQSNLGAMAAINRGLEEARGDYVHLASADDFAHPDFFRSVLALLGAHPEAGVGCGETRCIDGQGRTLGFRPIARPLWRAGFASPEATAALLSVIDHWILAGAALMRTDCLKAVGGLDVRFGSFADAYAVHQIALRYGFCYLPEIVADWRIVETSYSHSTAGNAQQCTTLLERAHQAISSDPVFPPWYADLYGRRLRFAFCRHAIQKRPFNAPVLAALGLRRPLDRIALAAAERLPALPARIAALAWLTLRYHPTSVPRVACTSLARYVERKRPRRPVRSLP